MKTCRGTRHAGCLWSWVVTRACVYGYTTRPARPPVAIEADDVAEGEGGDPCVACSSRVVAREDAWGDATRGGCVCLVVGRHS